MLATFDAVYDGQDPPALPTNGNRSGVNEWGSAGKDARFLKKLSRFLAEMNDGDRQLLLSFAQNVTKKQSRAAAKG